MPESNPQIDKSLTKKTDDAHKRAQSLDEDTLMSNDNNNNGYNDVDGDGDTLMSDVNNNNDYDDGDGDGDTDPASAQLLTEPEDTVNLATARDSIWSIFQELVSDEF